MAATADPPFSDASLDDPEGVFVDAAGNIYIADTDNSRVRMVDLAGVITTVAGNGVEGFSGDGGPATDASMDDPEGVFLDGFGSLYVADEDNNRIRKVDPNGTITTVVGNGEGAFSGDGDLATEAALDDPEGVYVDEEGTIFIADTDNSRIRKVDVNGIITTVAGNGTEGSAGDGGPATDASLNFPSGIFLDVAGDLYVADMDNHRIRKIEIGSAPKTPDFNGDGIVDFSDFIQFAQSFGLRKGDPDFDARLDLNDDDELNFPDFIQFAQAFGEPVGSG